MSRGNRNKTKRKQKEYSQNLDKRNFIDCHTKNSIEVVYLNLSAAENNLYRLL